MTRISDKVRALIYERDGSRCCHCGETEAIGLQHRISKGMGGSRLLDMPSNLLTMCNISNSAMEADPLQAEIARLNGWKLSRWQDTLTTPVWYRDQGRAYLLNNTYGRERAI
jgi:5-methylcytosine-specific restriction endonuclease McrA